MSTSSSAAAANAARLTSVSGRVVLVSGSTSGIGRAIAKHFLALGARVVVNGRTMDRTEAVANELAKEVGVDASNVFPVAADLGTAEGAASFVRQVRDAALVPDVLVCNTGFYRVVDFFEATDEDWLRYHNVNVMSTVRLCRAFLKVRTAQLRWAARARHISTHDAFVRRYASRAATPPRPTLLQGMLERNAGRVIIIASEAAVKPLAHMLPYSASKASQVCIARALSELTKGTRVTVRRDGGGRADWQFGRWVRAHNGTHPFSQVNSVLVGPTGSEGVMEYFASMAEREGEADAGTVIKSYFQKEEPTSLVQRLIKVRAAAAGAREGGCVRPVTPCIRRSKRWLLSWPSSHPMAPRRSTALPSAATAAWCATPEPAHRACRSPALRSSLGETWTTDQLAHHVEHRRGIAVGRACECVCVEPPVRVCRSYRCSSQ